MSLPVYGIPSYVSGVRDGTSSQIEHPMNGIQPPYPRQHLFEYSEATAGEVERLIASQLKRIFS